MPCDCNLTPAEIYCSFSTCLNVTDGSGNCLVTSSCEDTISSCVDGSTPQCISVLSSVPYCLTVCVCNVCPGSSPCGGSQCVYSPEEGCQWQMPLGGCPPKNTNKLNCDASNPNSTFTLPCNTTACAVLWDPKASVCVADSKYDYVCDTRCKANVNDTGVVFGCSCPGTIDLSPSQCSLVSVDNGLPSCQLVYENDVCTSFCTNFQIPYSLTAYINNVTLDSCDVNPVVPLNCLPTVSSLQCKNSSVCAQSLICGPGFFKACVYINTTGMCIQSCLSLSDGSSDCIVDQINVVCSVTEGPKPCANSVCQEDESGYCSWTTNGDYCYTEIPCIPGKLPDCPQSVCKKDINGAPYWDNSLCNNECFSKNMSSCPLGRDCGQNYGVPGSCVPGTDGNCIWLCPTPTDCTCNEIPPSATGCAYYIPQCVTSGDGCEWECAIPLPNENCDCGTLPPDPPSCTNQNNGIWNCTRSSKDGSCVWQGNCVTDITNGDQTTCSAELCTYVPPPSTSFCGIDVLTPSCRFVGGQCIYMWGCEPAIQVEPVASSYPCQYSKCKNYCYDPRWLSGDLPIPITLPQNLSDLVTYESEIECPATSICNVDSCTRLPGSYLCQFVPSSLSPQAHQTCINQVTSSNQTIELVDITCSGIDPCQCSYSDGCVYFTANFGSGSTTATSGQCISQSDLATVAGGYYGSTSIYVIDSAPLYCDFFDFVTPNLPASTVSILNQYAALTVSNFSEANVLKNISNAGVHPIVDVLCLPYVDSDDPTVVHFSLILSRLDPYDNNDEYQNDCDYISSTVVPKLLLINDTGLTFTNCNLFSIPTGRDGLNQYYLLQTQNTPMAQPPSPETNQPSSSPQPGSPGSPSSSPSSAPKPSPHPSPKSPSPAPHVAPLPVPSPLGEGSRFSVWPTLFLSIVITVLRYVL